MIFNNGAILNDRYEILRQVGEGGFATVYKGRDLQLNRDVAIKILKTAAQGEDLERFYREAKLLGGLSHKNIVSAFVFDILPGSVPFITMEYLDGKSLRQTIFEKGALSEDEVVCLLPQCLQALSYAHKNGVVHRDLSPNNIYLSKETGETVLKILDFGLSKLFLQGEAKLTATGVLLGNPPYMSPEQTRGEPLDARSDIYAIGTVLFECIVGKPAFAADSAIAYVFAQQNNYPCKPEFHWKNAERAKLYKHILLRCLQKDTAKRFQSCDEILALLDSPESALFKDLETLDKWNGQSVNSQQIGLFGHIGSSGKIWKTGVLLFIMSLLCLIVSSDFGYDLATKIFTSSSRSISPELENTLAAYFSKSQRLSESKKLYAHLAASYLVQRDVLNAAKAQLSLARIGLKSGESESAVDTLRTVLKELAAVQDSDDKQKILSLVWSVLASVSKSDQLSGRIIGLESLTLRQSLDSTHCSKTYLSRCFDTLLLNIEKIRRLDSQEDTHEALETMALYIKKFHPVFSDRDILIIDIFTAQCLSIWKQRLECQQLTRARIANAHIHKNDDFDLRFILVNCLIDTDAKEALKVVQSMNDAHGIYARASVLSLEYEIYGRLQHDHRRALQCCQQGMKLLADQAILNRVGLELTLGAISSLFHLNRIEEMDRLSKQTVNLICGSSLPQATAHGTILGVTVPDGHVYNQREIVESQSLWWLVYDCLVETQQADLSTKVLRAFKQNLQQRQWPLSPLSIERLNRGIAEERDQQRLTIMKEIAALPH